MPAIILSLGVSQIRMIWFLVKMMSVALRDTNLANGVENNLYVPQIVLG